SKPETVIDLRKEGFKGFLMGENFMKTNTPGQTLKEFITGLSPNPSPQGKGAGERSKIKVCGMKHPSNIAELSQLPIDMMGLIFYEKSPRYAGDLDADALRVIPENIWKIGVFVNASETKVLDKVERYDLQAVQLHGNETPEYCKKMKEKGIVVIKTFQIAEPEDFTYCTLYNKYCDFFLFDTKTPQYGGSGKKFDWQILSAYTGKTPFFLSGGIGLEDAEFIRNLNFPGLYAVDLNSKFEILPGTKDIEKIKTFLTTLDSTPQYPQQK
ncbi:MAG: bifunctional indole-3-glycerol phosphate synthase/phosphoribosylanthranilate isomerase, partial [Candidatus Symbiothrix sp.]|nr:bifunctional indole-3-glycerol phosphate synthase/phosphoribosylanthranilate isomerase [Candidatus Symbiothrix sp.]